MEDFKQSEKLIRGYIPRHTVLGNFQEKSKKVPSPKFTKISQSNTHNPFLQETLLKETTHPILQSEETTTHWFFKNKKHNN